MGEMRIDMTNLEQQLAAAKLARTNEREQLQAQLAEAAALREKEKAEYLKEIERLKRQLSEKEITNESLRKDVSRQEEQLRLKGERGNGNAKVCDLEKQLAEARHNLIEAKDTIAHLEGKAAEVDNLRMKLEGLSKMKRELIEEVDSL